MPDLSGRWIGRIEGTNSGNFLLDLEQRDGAVSGQARLNDLTFGVCAFDLTGKFADGELLLNLVPREVMPGVELSHAEVHGVLKGDGSIRGEWHADQGTAGTLVAVREQHVQQGLSTLDPQAAAATAFAYEKATRIPSCVVDYDMLRQLHRALFDGAVEALRIALGNPSNKIDEKVLRLAHAITISARGTNGETLLTIDPVVLTQESLPRPLQFIRLELGLNHKIILNGTEAPNRAAVTLDFSKPRALDLSNAQGAPTPNNSSISVYGTGSIWVSGVYQRLLATVEQGKTRVRLLHSAYVYDLLLLTLGLPFVLTFAAVVSHRVAMVLSFGPEVYTFATFILMLAVALMTFKLAFSFARWLLPYVEFAPQKQPLERRIRAVLAVLILGILGSLGAWMILRLLQAG
jgi:hypothetical protein